MIRDDNLTTFMCCLGILGTSNFWSPKGLTWPLPTNFSYQTESSPWILCVQPINPKLQNNDTNKLVTVLTTSKCNSVTQFRPCPSQRTATSIGNKPHPRSAGTVHCPVLRGTTCFYLVSPLEYFRMCHDHLLPNSYVLTIFDHPLLFHQTPQSLLRSW